jgi:hypothetical protein
LQSELRTKELSEKLADAENSVKLAVAKAETMAEELEKSDNKARELTAELEKYREDLEAAKAEAAMKKASINLPGSCYDDIMAFALDMQEKAVTLVNGIAEKGEELKKLAEAENTVEITSEDTAIAPENTDMEQGKTDIIITAESDESIVEPEMISLSETEETAKEEVVETEKTKTTKKSSAKSTGTKKTSGTKKSSSKSSTKKSTSGTKSTSRKKKSEEPVSDEQDIMTLEEIAANIETTQQDIE